MKTIELEKLGFVCGGGSTSLGEMSAWRSGMAQRGPRTNVPVAPFPRRIPANTSIGEIGAWRSGMSQDAPGKK